MEPGEFVQAWSWNEQFGGLIAILRKTINGGSMITCACGGAPAHKPARTLTTEGSRSLFSSEIRIGSGRPLRWVGYGE